MKTCLIPPIPDLRRYVDDHCTYHMLLSHLFDVPGYGDEYRAFYRDRAARGDYVIIDNGTKELGESLGIERSLQLAKDIGARELILSDVRFDSFATLEATERDLAWLLSEGLALYEQASKPALMIVPQGGSFPAWQACLIRLLEKVENANHVLHGPEPVVGVAYAYGHRFECDFRELVFMARVPQLPVHLLGWPRHLLTLPLVATEFPDLRSVDSSRPFTYARTGQRLGEGEYPGRGDRYFIQAVPDRFGMIVRDNIDLFRVYARDEQPDRATAA